MSATAKHAWKGVLRGPFQVDHEGCSANRGSAAITPIWCSSTSRDIRKKAKSDRAGSCSHSVQCPNTYQVYHYTSKPMSLYHGSAGSLVDENASTGRKASQHRVLTLPGGQKNIPRWGTTSLPANTEQHPRAGTQTRGRTNKAEQGSSKR